jgi:hypothetical protein
VLTEVGRVGVGEHDDVAAGHGQAAPHGVALAVGAPVLGQQLVLGVDLGAVAAGDAGRAVGRVSVDDHDLLDEPGTVVQPGHGVEDGADGLGRVPGRQDQGGGERKPVRAFGEAAEVLIVERALLEPLPHRNVHMPVRLSFRPAEG